MDSGHDPRRFLTDLLERFRDLVIVKAVPNAATSGLIEAPDDLAARMATQAGRFGPADLVRLADIVDEGITAMKGATPTRLQLELVCARLLLPGADGSATAMQARLDRLERRPSLDEAGSAMPDDVSAEPTAPADGETDNSAVDTDAAAVATEPESAIDAPAPATAEDHLPEQSASAGPAGGTADVRRLWPEVLVRLREIKRTPWSLISQQAAVIDVSDGVLTLAFRQPSLRDTFVRREDFQANLRAAMADVLGVELRVEAIVDPAVQSGLTAPAGAERSADRQSEELPAPITRPVVPQRTPDQPLDDDVSPDDPDHVDDSLSERQLLERALGAKVIEEIEHR
jgi:DNA polymerase-3 subunit gamma/tau